VGASDHTRTTNMTTADSLDDHRIEDPVFHLLVWARHDSRIVHKIPTTDINHNRGNTSRIPSPSNSKPKTKGTHQ
jgi:hypothetical protein